MFSLPNFMRSLIVLNNAFSFAICIEVTNVFFGRGGLLQELYYKNFSRIAHSHRYKKDFFSFCTNDVRFIEIPLWLVSASKKNNPAKSISFFLSKTKLGIFFYSINIS